MADKNTKSKETPQPAPKTGSDTPPEQNGIPTWASLHLWQIQPLRDVLVVFVVIGILLLGQKISVVTVPVLLAILFAYLFEPVIRWITARSRLERRSAVILIIAACILTIVGPVTLGLTYGIIQGVGTVARTAENITLVNNYTDATEAPQVEITRNRLQNAGGHAWVWIGDKIRGDDNSNLAIMFDNINEWAQANAERIAKSAAGVSTGIFKTALALLTGTFSLLFMAFLTAFFFFFFSTEWIGFKGFTQKLIPDKHHDTIIVLALKFDRVISCFVRGRLTIAFIQAIIFTIGYWIIGVPAAFILGPVVAILSIVPYMALIGVPISIILLWLENHTGIRGHWLWIVSAPVLLYFAGQALDDYVLTPIIQGKETGMSTPMILFASLAGGVLFGIFGLLIAIPIAACLKIIIEEILWPRFKAWAEGDADDFLPFSKT